MTKGQRSMTDAALGLAVQQGAPAGRPANLTEPAPPRPGQGPADGDAAGRFTPAAALTPPDPSGVAGPRGPADQASPSPPPEPAGPPGPAPGPSRPESAPQTDSDPTPAPDSTAAADTGDAGDAGDRSDRLTRPTRTTRGRLPRPGPPRTAQAPIAVVRRSPVAQTAALHESLADKAAQAVELREALDELRQVLDGSGPAGVARTPSRRRRRGVWWLVGAAALIVVAVIAASVLPGGRRTSAAPAPGPSTSAATVIPLPWPGGPVLIPPDAVTTGPGVDSPGTDLTVAIDPDRVHLDVYERVDFAAPGVHVVAAALPPRSGLSAELASAPVRVESLQIQLDGTPAPVVNSPAGWSATAPGGVLVTRAVLRYRLAGAIVRQVPSVLGRFSAVVVSLTGAASGAAGLPVDVRIDDRRVLSLYCPDAPDPLCATATGSTLTAVLPAGTAPVLALQLDLMP